MKISILTITVVTATALAAFGQEGAVENVKHEAKKAGQTVKNGLETAGKKDQRSRPNCWTKNMKETAETVGHKTKETARNSRQKDQGNC